jgi:uncharacterized membrane protein YhhN
LLVPALVTATATLGLVAAEARASRAAIWLCKPIAAAGFVAAALAAGATSSPYGVWILVGLVLSFAGDVLLIPRGARGFFLAGLGAFLLGHVAYTIAFAVRGLDLASVAIAALPVAAAGLFALRYLWPHVQRNAPKLQWPVLAYMTVISSMVATAAGTFGHAADWRIPLGAFSFYLSDLAVARQRFVADDLSNKIWGLPLYFGAQLLLAWSVAP